VKVVLKSSEGAEFTVSDGAVMGRVDGVEIVIPDPKMSRKHAKFTLVDDALTIEDLGSSNGTCVNGIKIQTPTLLNHGDTISIEHLAFRVVIDDAELPEVDEATVLGAVSDDATVIGAPMADLSNVPGSWVESNSGDSTQFLNAEQSAEQSIQVERRSPEAHLVLLDSQGGVAEALGLDVNGEGNQQWEIGRGDQCDVQLADSTVSTRHAQLVCEAGKWRVVNLISSNGILVNGEKRLSAFLSDGDVIGLGRAQLVFYGPIKSAQKTGGSSGKKGSNTVMLAAVGVVIAIAAITALLLL
jgi:pSer/pThr/pTyr-binding forkhead associated (FHA) protein